MAKRNLKSKHPSVRIIAGQWRRRRLVFPALAHLRPTPDRVRETLFNWLAPKLEGAHCLDLYAGSGALGFEAASRGAARVVMVERDPQAVQCLRQHLETLQADMVEVVHADVRVWLASGGARFDIVFVDPPYGAAQAVATCNMVASSGLLDASALVYVEQASDLDETTLPAGWCVEQARRAGQVRYYLISAAAMNQTP